MAIERSLTESPIRASEYLQDRDEFDEALAKARGDLGPSLEVEIIEVEPASMETEDGGVLIDFDPDADSKEEVEFGANLAEHMDDSALGILASDLIGSYQGDRSSRKDWEETYVKGLSQLGLKLDERTSPWEGACGVTHPISESGDWRNLSVRWSGANEDCGQDDSREDPPVSPHSGLHELSGD